MDLKRLLGLRPKTESAEAIGAAIAGATAARDVALAEIVRIEEGRPALLAGGTEGEIVAAEAALATARAEAEQLAALVTGLQPRLEVATHQRQLIELRALAAQAETASQKFAEFMGEEYRQLAARLGAGMHFEKTALQINERLYEAMNAAPAAAAEAGLTRSPPYPAVAVYPNGGIRMETTTICNRVHLPAPAGSSGPEDANWVWLKPQPGAQ